jgi:hypothetical protein
MRLRIANQLDRFTLWLGDFAPDWTLSVPGIDWLDTSLRDLSCRLVGHLPRIEMDRRSVVCSDCFHVLAKGRSPEHALRLESEWKLKSKR